MSDDESRISDEQEPAPDEGRAATPTEPPSDEPSARVGPPAADGEGEAGADAPGAGDASAASGDEESLPDDAASRRRVVIAVVTATIVFAAVLGAWALLSREDADDSANRQTIEPAEETTPASSVITSSVEATASTEDTDTTPGAATGSADEAAGRGADGSGSQKRSDLIAYRVGDKIWVGRDDGTGGKAVATSTVEPYALSPDGTTLAVVDADPKNDGNRITLYDVEGGTSRRVGRGVVTQAPSWAPDSSWLAYSAARGGIGEVHRVGADGRGDALVARPGAGPAVDPTGEHVAFRQGSDVGSGEPLAVKALSAEAIATIEGSVGALEWTWGRDGTLLLARIDADGRPAVWRSDAEGSPATLVAKRTAAGPTFALAHLCPSPTSSEVLLAEIGDDGYSRLLVLRDGRFVQIATRRDAYPLCWSADGGWTLYFEGNAFQGEPSRLVRARSDGRDSQIIVEGAAP